MGQILPSFSLDLHLCNLLFLTEVLQIYIRVTKIKF